MLDFVPENQAILPEKYFFANIGFIPPELYDKTDTVPGIEVDMWCMGILFYRILSKNWPFEGETGLKIMRKNQICEM